jgi:hypothetical protein
VLYAQPLEASPNRRLIAVDYRLIEILLQNIDRFNHPSIGAAQKIAVRFGASIFMK